MDKTNENAKPKKKIFKCEKCSKKYPSLSSLRRHCVVWNHGDFPTRDEIKESQLEKEMARIKELQVKEMMKCTTLFHELDNVEDSNGYLTFSLQDGNVAVNKLHILLKGEFLSSILKDVIKSDEFITLTRIIIPDMTVESFQHFVELMSKGVSQFDNMEDLKEVLDWTTGVFMFHNIHQYENITLQNKKWNIFEQKYEESKMSLLKKVHASKNTKIEEINCFPDKRDSYCRFCLKEFYNSSVARRHEDFCEKNLEHHPHHECEQCGHKTLTQQGLKLHIERKHEKVMNSSLYECETCSKKYKSLTSLKRHCNEFSHPFPQDDQNNENPNDNKCRVCFKVVKNLEEHLKKHGKLYSCPQCDYSSTRKDNLTRHKQQKHKLFKMDFGAVTSSFSSSSKVIYTCPKCNKEIDDEDEVKYHMRLKRCQEFKCMECGREFSMKHHLKSHLKTIHKLTSNLMKN